MEKENELKKWVRVWEIEQAKNSQLEMLLGDNVDIDHEIRNLERLLELEQRKNSGNSANLAQAY